MSTSRPCIDCKPGRLCRTHRQLELAKQRADAQAKVARELAQVTAAKTCPECGCPGRTCVIPLEGGGEGVCAPAGELGAKICSACALKRPGAAA